MYYIVVLAFMLVLPLVSIAVDAGWFTGGSWLMLVGKWFVFWAVGVRLFTAGIRQIVDPAFTAQTIFETSDPGAQVLVQELGFANLAAGTAGILSLGFPEWVKPVAVYAMIFYGAAAIKHVMKTGKNSLETAATVSDAWIALLMLAFLAGAVLWRS